MKLHLPNSNHKLIDNAKIQLAIYALTNTIDHAKAARLIGITDRTLRLWLNKYEELRIFKKEKTISKSPYWDNNDTWKRNSYA